MFKYKYYTKYFFFASFGRAYLEELHRLTLLPPKTTAPRSADKTQGSRSALDTLS